MTNDELLATLKQAFDTFLRTGSRSNQKLKVLHPKIANDILLQLGAEYSARSLGIGDEKEALMPGRYFDKKVDITFYKGDQPVAGLGVKMVMQNYAQNANNYFENMLGETANLRSNTIPYFQLFAIPDRLPHYNNKNHIIGWEVMDEHYINKYFIMSQDDPGSFMHTPTKTLLFVYHIPDATINLTTKQKYQEYYLQHLPDLDLTLSPQRHAAFGSTVIFNDYRAFIEKVAHYILSI